MSDITLYITPYALDHAITVHCLIGFSIIEMDYWWAELWLDYDVMLAAENDNRIAA